MALDISKYSHHLYDARNTDYTMERDPFLRSGEDLYGDKAEDILKYSPRHNGRRAASESDRSSTQSRPPSPNIMEGSPAYDYSRIPKHGSQCEPYDSRLDEEELVYVEESQPMLSNSLDNIPLQFTAENEDKVLEINVDDPYDLCSLLAAEKANNNQISNRKRMYSGDESDHGTVITKCKDSRINKLKAFKYPYKCSRCESWFIDSRDLKLHMSTHKEINFKSVKDFIHEKIFKSTEIDKVVINAPVYVQPCDSIVHTVYKEIPLAHEMETVPLIPAMHPEPTAIYNAQHHPIMENKIHDGRRDTHFRSPPPFDQHNISCKQEQRSQQIVILNNLPAVTHMKPVKKEPVLYSCDKCEQRFYNKEDLSMHLFSHRRLDDMKSNYVHKDIKVEESHPCSYCYEKFESSAELSVHLLSHRHNRHNEYSTRKAKTEKPVDKNPYKCNSCSASFGTAYNLKRHIRIHTGTRPYKCERCQAAFITKAQLTTHIRTHTGEKPYQCHICGGKFIQQNNLKRHIMTHTGEKPFKCDKCTAAFISSSDLKRHIRVHTGEKPYKCIHCNKGFTTSGNLASHYKMHTGERPYKCKQCDATFSHQSNLKTHMKRHSDPNYVHYSGGGGGGSVEDIVTVLASP